ncbi:MAG: hypothetical protein K6G53_02430 [Bacteroidales bacterium]|nr:hypothetical protein [Bacteroidales bacterium]
MHLPDSFLKDKTVLFVAGDDGAVESYIEDSREYLAERFEDNGYTLLYLPELVGNLEPSLMGYLFPGSEGEPLVGEMYRRIREYAGLDGKSGFLYKKNGQTIL